MPTFDVSIGGVHRYRLQATNEQYALHEAAVRMGYVDADDMRTKAPEELGELAAKRVHGALFGTMRELKDAVSEARERSLRDSHKACGRRGFHQSRGAWIIVTHPTRGEHLIGAGQMQWDGTMRQLARVVEDAQADGADSVQIEGGHDFAATMDGHREGDYEAYSGEWAVTVWEA